MKDNWVSPEDLLEPTLQLLSTAEKSIRMVIIGPAPEETLGLLLDKSQAGVDVWLLLEHSGAAKKTMLAQRTRLAAAGVQYLAATEKLYGWDIIKDGYIVVDDEYILSGRHTFGVDGVHPSWLFLEHDPVAARVKGQDFLTTRNFLVGV